MHIDIEQYQREIIFLDGSQCLLAACGFDNVEIVSGHDLPEHGADCLIIIYYKNKILTHIKLLFHIITISCIIILNIAIRSVDFA